MARRRLLTAALAVCALVALPAAASADTFTVTEGGTLDVKIVDQSGTSVTGTVDSCMSTFIPLPMLPVTTYSVVYGADAAPVAPVSVWSIANPGMPNSPCTGSLRAQQTYPSVGTFPLAVYTHSSGGIMMGSSTSVSLHTVVVEPAAVSGATTSRVGTAGAPTTGVVASVTNGLAAIDPERFVVAVNWGDGTSSIGTASAASGALTVGGQHTYAAAGSYAITASVLDLHAKGKRTQISGGTATIAAAPAAVVQQPDAASTVKHCVVPKLVGLKLAAAKTAIAKANCKLGKVTYKKGLKSSAGKVLKAPKAGAKLALNAKLALTVGK